LRFGFSVSLLGQVTGRGADVCCGDLGGGDCREFVSPSSSSLLYQSSGSHLARLPSSVIAGCVCNSAASRASEYNTTLRSCSPVTSLAPAITARMVPYGMVNVDLYSAIITKVSNAPNTLVSGEKPGFQALSKGLVVLLCAEVVRQGVPDHGAVHSECSAASNSRTRASPPLAVAKPSQHGRKRE